MTQERKSSVLKPVATGSAFLPLLFNLINAIGPTASPIYVNKYFEVREHDTPAKFVWNGNTRVARMAGSSTNTIVVQRLRLYPGFNLVSLTVTAPKALSQLSTVNLKLIQSAFEWDQPAQTWQPVAKTDTLAAGSVLWVNATTNATVQLVGTPPTTPPPTVPAGASYQPAAVLAAAVLPTLARLDTTIAFFDPVAKAWQMKFALPLGNWTNPLVSLPTFGAVFFRASLPLSLANEGSSSTIGYYHEDHLGSSASLSDSVGNPIQETAFYAFGSTRSENKPVNLLDPYAFIQKERDLESGLQYFEARYLAATLARFTGVDPFGTENSRDLLDKPQAQNGYAYGANNPLYYKDPDGKDVLIVVGRGGKAQAADEKKFLAEANKLKTELVKAGVHAEVVNLAEGKGKPEEKISAKAEEIQKRGGRVTGAVFVGHSRRSGRESLLELEPRAIRNPEHTIELFAKLSKVAQGGVLVGLACDFCYEQTSPNGVKAYGFKGEVGHAGEAGFQAVFQRGKGAINPAEVKPTVPEGTRRSVKDILVESDQRLGGQQ